MICETDTILYEKLYGPQSLYDSISIHSHNIKDSQRLITLNSHTKAI